MSEDVDLLVVRDRFEPSLSRRGIDRELVAMKDAVAAHPGLTWEAGRESVLQGKARSDVFAYGGQFRLGGIKPEVLTEPGVRGGEYPTVDRELDSYVGRFVREAGRADLAEDLDPFSMTTLHFRRTFVEKLFVIHALVERLKTGGAPLGASARHYIDVHALAGRPEVRQMLESEEYLEIKEDHERLSERFFKRTYRRPPDLSFSRSDAVFPSKELRRRIVPDFDEQCRTLCYGPYPSFEEVLERFEDLRELL